MPVFSIIIPCYNQAHFLDDALLSLCNQTFSDWEAIIVNDGSPDNTIEVAEGWIVRDKRIRLISQQNSGLSAARNTGIAASDGKYITLLDADDKYGADFLQLILQHFEKGFEWVACGYTYFNTTGTLNRCVTLSKQLNIRSVLTGNLFPPVAVAFKKSVLGKTNLFDVSLKSAEDWDLWIRMYRAGISFGVISESLVYYRISDNSMSRQPLTMYKALKEVAQRVSSIDGRLNNQVEIDLQAVRLLPCTIKKLLMMCMGVAVMQGKIAEAIELILKEKEEYSFELHEADFKDMCSYLSFRYRVTNNDFAWVKKDLKPLFTLFFNELTLPNLDKKKANAHVFKIHRHLMNQKKWGFISPLINQFS